MEAFYPWFVLAHLLGVVLFLVSHGASVWVAFAIRGQHDTAVISTYLALSQRAVGFMYLGLALLGIGGIVAAIAANLLTAPWVVASAAVLIVVLVGMYAIATPHFIKLRQGLTVDPATDTLGASAEELTALLQSRRPEALLAIGGIGLTLLVWLMTVKPG